MPTKTSLMPDTSALHRISLPYVRHVGIMLSSHHKRKSSYVLTGSSSKFLFHKKSAYTCLTTCSNMTLFGLRLSVHFGASKLSPLLYVTRAGVVTL